jgi:hypothetical protein
MASDPVLTRPQMIAFCEDEAKFWTPPGHKPYKKGEYFRAIAQALQEDRPEVKELALIKTRAKCLRLEHLLSDDDLTKRSEMIAALKSYELVASLQIELERARAVPEDAAPTPPPAEIEKLDYQAHAAALKRPCGAYPCDKEYPALPSRWCNGCLINALLRRATPGSAPR